MYLPRTTTISLLLAIGSISYCSSPSPDDPTMEPLTGSLPEILQIAASHSDPTEAVINPLVRPSELKSITAYSKEQYTAELPNGWCTTYCIKYGDKIHFSSSRFIRQEGQNPKLLHDHTEATFKLIKEAFPTFQKVEEEKL